MVAYPFGPSWAAVGKQVTAGYAAFFFGSSGNFVARFGGLRTGAGLGWGDGNTSHPLRPTAGTDDSWRVEAVDLRLEDRRVEIRLKHVGSGVICPDCGRGCGLADHADERRWRHLDTMQFTTELVARLPRCRCPEHGVKTTPEQRHQLWLFNKSNRSWKQRRRFAAIRRNGPKKARAWAIKEEFRWFWRHVYSTSAEAFFNRWYAWGARSRPRPVVKVAKMLKRHLPNLLSYFLYRITNATSEGFNSVIQGRRGGFSPFAQSGHERP